MNRFTTICIAGLTAGAFALSVLAQSPATPAKPAAPATAATPAAPATAAKPATPATAATPATPGTGNKRAMRDCSTAKDPGRCEARKKVWQACKDKKAGAERHDCMKANRPAKSTAAKS